jgi:transglutaminase-like putative cysteine protease
VTSAGLNPKRLLVGVAYGLVLAAFVPIWLSGEVGTVAPLVFAVAGIASLALDPYARTPWPWTARIWTLGLFVAFGLLIAWSLQDGNWLLHALQFALLLTASRFFQRRFAIHYLQLQALSFILLLVAAVVNPGPVFGACFLLYAVGTIWGLTLVHLHRELEVQTCSGPEHLLPTPAPRRWPWSRKAKPVAAVLAWPQPPVPDSVLTWRSRKLIGGRFLLSSSLLALGVLTASALFFVLFPRLGMGFFFAQTRGAQNVVGFGTDAELGHFGALKSSAEVVARVRFPDDPARAEQPVRLRGITFDQFAGTGWTRVAERAWGLPHRMGKYYVGRPDVDPAHDRVVTAEVYLEPLGVTPRVLFTPPQPAAVEVLDVRFDYLRGRRRRVLASASGDLTYEFGGEKRLTTTAGQGLSDTAIHYRVEFTEPMRETQEIERLRTAPVELPRRVARRWTEVPDGLDPRIALLAKQLAGSATNRYDQATYIENALRNGWKYSLAGDQDAQKPLEDFLFGKKSGHCEYFATSMALLLRTLGHAARPVHGFYGGAHNGYGGYRMIRQGDAHAWVEVFFPEIGWRTFDPTPAGGQGAPVDDGALVAAMRQLADSAALAWYQWVVEYDLERQVEVMRGLYGALQTLRQKAGWKGLTAGESSFGTADDSASKRKIEVPWPIALSILGAAAVAVGAVVLWRRRKRGPATVPREVQRAADRLDHALQKAGWGRRAWETWTLVADRLTRLDSATGTSLRHFARAYDQVRYAPSASASDQAAVTATGQLAATAVVVLARAQKPRRK